MLSSASDSLAGAGSAIWVLLAAVFSSRGVVALSGSFAQVRAASQRREDAKIWELVLIRIRPVERAR